MKTIKRLEIKENGFAVIPLPKFSKILSIGVENDTPFIYILLDTEKEKEDRIFYVVKTGEEIGDEYFNIIEHIGSYGGRHFFEMLSLGQVVMKNFRF